jgi:DNA-directed RNA polymerase subunit RPC12/RpoP
MIEISLTTAILLYLAALAVLAAAIYVYTLLSAGRVYRSLENQYVWKCYYCAYTYLDAHAEQLSQCPRCGSYNVLGEESMASTRSEEGGPEKETELSTARPRRNPSHRKHSHRPHRGPRRRR